MLPHRLSAPSGTSDVHRNVWLLHLGQVRSVFEIVNGFSRARHLAV